MIEQEDSEPASVAPAGRYAKRECADCGIILPANQMYQTKDRKLTGYSESNRSYKSITGRRSSGGTTSERYVIKDISLCSPCFESRQAHQLEQPTRSSAGFVILMIFGLLVVVLLYAFVIHGAGAVSASDTASPTPNGPDDNSASSPSTDSTAENAAALAQPDPTLTATPSQADTSPTLPTSEKQAQAETADGNPPAAVDCSGAASVVVSMICNDAGLRSQNARLAPIYKTLFARATPDQRGQFAQEQSAWISQRNACDTQPCLATAYSQRLKAVTAEAWNQYNARNGPGPDTIIPSPSPTSPPGIRF